MFKKLLFWSMWPVVRGYTGLLLKMDVVHHAPIPKGPKVIVANHPTTLDPFFVCMLAGGPSRILIKDLVFKVPLFGKYLHHAGHIPVIAGQGRQAIAAALDTLKAGGTIILFPEGKLSPKNSFWKPHTGAARIALASGVPVVPIGIHVPRQGMKFSSDRLDGRFTVSRWPVRTPYNLTIGAPFDLHGDVQDRDSVRGASEEIMAHIRQLSHVSKLRLLPPPPAWSPMLQSTPAEG